MIRWSKCCADIYIDGSSLAQGSFFGLIGPSAESIKARDKYEADVLAVLNKIGMTETGRAVFRALHDNGLARGKTVTIVPFEGDDDNAYVEAVGGGPEDRNAAPRGVKQYLGGADNVKTPEDEREVKSLFTGTGLGVSCRVHYNPKPPVLKPGDLCPLDGRTWKGGCPQYEGADNDPDDTLLHELVHALRMLRGEFNQVPTWDRDWVNEEEFLAILVTNTYLSEKGKKHLRGTHLGQGVLSAELNTSEKFLGKGASPPSLAQLQHRRIVYRLVSEDWALCRDLTAKVKTGFNPIGEFMRNAHPYYPLSPK